MRGLVAAWVAGIGLMCWREVAATHKPVVPGQIAAASGVFAALGLLATYQPAAPVAALAAWGFDLAVLLQVAPGWSVPASSAPGSSGGSSSNGSGGTGSVAA